MKRYRYFIYVLYLGEKPFYVGCTINLAARYVAHVTRTHFKCNRRNISMKIVDTVTSQFKTWCPRAINQESYWIERMLKINPKLENKRSRRVWLQTRPSKTFIKIYNDNPY